MPLAASATVRRVRKSMYFFRLYAAAAIKNCLQADSFPFVYTFLILLKLSNVPRTCSTVAERRSLIRRPFGDLILS